MVRSKKAACLILSLTMLVTFCTVPEYASLADSLAEPTAAVTPAEVTATPFAEAAHTLLLEETPAFTPEIILTPAAEDTPAPTPVTRGALPEAAIPINLGETVSGEITADVPALYFLVNAPSDGSYAFISGGSLRVKAQLLNEAQQPMAEFTPNVPEADGGDPTHFAYDAALAKGKDYYLKVESSRAGSLGRFSISFARVQSPTAEPTAEPTLEPTAEPTVEPTVEPTLELTVEPTVEPSVEPTVEPTVELTVEPSVEPTAEPAVEPTAAPAVEAAAPTIETTAEPTAEPALAPTATPLPTDGLSAILASSSGKQEIAFLQNPAGSPVSALAGGTQLKASFMEAAIRASSYPESAHPYLGGTDTSWYYEVPGAIRLNITFSQDTQTEAWYDKIYLYDANGSQMTFVDDNGGEFGYFTGNQLAGVTLSVNSGAFYIRLVADGSVERYGFAITAVSSVYLDAPQQISVSQAAIDAVNVAWQPSAGAEGYDVYRAAGAGGASVKVASVSGTAYTDAQVTPGEVYSYAVAAYKTVLGTQVFSSTSDSKQLQAMGVMNAPTVMVDGPRSAVISWESVPGASGYAVEYTTTPGGAFTAAGYTAELQLHVFNLSAAKRYFFRVTPYIDGGVSKVMGYASAVREAIILPAPGVRSAEQSTATSIALSWTRVSKSSGYSVYFALAPEGPYTLIRSSAGTSFTHRGLTPGQTYYYYIQPYRTISRVRYYGTATAPVAVTMLAAPSITSITDAGASAASIVWTAVPAAGGYTVYRSTRPTSGFRAIGNTGATTGVASGLATGKTYYFKVAAYKQVGRKKVYGPASAVVSIQFMGAPAIQFLDQTAQDGITLRWSAVTGAQAYSVLRSTTPDSGFTAILTTADTVFQDTGLLPGQAYYYRVQAGKLADGAYVFGPASQTASVQLMGKPVITSLSAVSATSARLIWNAVPSASAYVVLRSVAGGEFAAVGTVPGATAEIGSLIAETTYAFQVAALKVVDGLTVYGPISDAVSFTMPAATVPPDYRALLIGQADYWYTNDLNGNYDAANMRTMLNNLSFDGQAYNVTVKNNQTASQILSSISSAFAGADENDVSLFYYSGHGDASTTSYAGSLIGVDSNGVYPSQLRAALDAVPGKVIVILDSCGSGSYVYSKSAQSTEASVTKAEAGRFNGSIINSFSAVKKTGELLTNKYVVLTACGYAEYSYEYSMPGHDPFGAFTLGLCDAGGWDLYNKSLLGLMGDFDGDSTVTVAEAYSRARSVVNDIGAEQTIQAYPAGSTYPLFRR